MFLFLFFDDSLLYETWLLSITDIVYLNQLLQSIGQISAQNVAKTLLKLFWSTFAFDVTIVLQNVVRIKNCLEE